MADNEKLIRNKAAGIRLDPKTRYLAKMAARYLAINPGFKSHSLSSFAEFAIQYVLRSDVMAQIEAEFEANTRRKHVSTWGENLWEEEKCDRFYRLATLRPVLLSTDGKNFWTLFTMHMTHSKKKASIQAFREFWNAPGIDTAHLADGDD